MTAKSLNVSVDLLVSYFLKPVSIIKNVQVKIISEFIWFIKY